MPWGRKGYMESGGSLWSMGCGILEKVIYDIIIICKTVMGNGKNGFGSQYPS